MTQTSPDIHLEWTLLGVLALLWGSSYLFIKVAVAFLIYFRLIWTLGSVGVTSQAFLRPGLASCSAWPSWAGVFRCRLDWLLLAITGVAAINLRRARHEPG